MMLIGVTSMYRLEKFDRLQQHPQPDHPQFSAQSAICDANMDQWILPMVDMGVIQTRPASVAQEAG